MDKMSSSLELPNFPTKTKREPKVIVFEEPKFTSQRQNGGPAARKKRKHEQVGNDVEFTDIAREVKEFGMSGFSRKEQRKNKQRYAEYLGAYKQKSQKVPYPLLMERVKQRKAKEEKQRNIEEAMGIFKKKKKEDKTNFTVKHNLGRWVDKSRVDGLGRGGRGKKDTMRLVNKHELRKIQNMKI